MFGVSENHHYRKPSGNFRERFRFSSRGCVPNIQPQKGRRLTFANVRGYRSLFWGATGQNGDRSANSPRQTTTRALRYGRRSGCNTTAGVFPSVAKASGCRRALFRPRQSPRCKIEVHVENDEYEHDSTCNEEPFYVLTPNKDD